MLCGAAYKDIILLHNDSFIHYKRDKICVHEVVINLILVPFIVFVIDNFRGRSVGSLEGTPRFHEEQPNHN